MHNFTIDDLRTAGVTSIAFGTLPQAIAFAMLNGGWICHAEDCTLWFDPQTWQPTAIIEATTDKGTRTIGTWPMFSTN